MKCLNFEYISIIYQSVNMKPIISAIFREFDRSDIIFCHWKSNQRLNSFVNGKEDLDLLFREEDKDLVLSLMYNVGAKKFEAIPLGKYLYIYDFLIVDEEGELIHFHVHFGLDIGEKGIKRYRLPITNSFLESRVRSNPENVWIPSYSYELLLLLLRLSLRFPPVVHLKYKLKKNSYGIDKKSTSELEWLRNKVAADEFKLVVGKHFDDKLIVESLIDLFQPDQTTSKILMLRSALSSKRIEWMEKSDAYVNYKYIVGRLKLNRFQRTLFLKPSKRLSTSGGRVVVILGSDGAGKSTLVKNLNKSFSRKIDVCNLYMGLPKPSKSNKRLLAKLFRRLRLFPLWNAIVKKGNIYKGNKFRSLGALVICDRFPQHYYNGIMDGPLLNGWKNSSNPIKKYASKKEYSLFKSMANMKIDLVIKLVVDSETSSRRGKHSIEMANHKTGILGDLDFPNVDNTMELDTSKMNEEEVTKEASKEIWKLYK